jgi:hypothetical protein
MSTTGVPFAWWSSQTVRFALATPLVSRLIVIVDSVPSETLW